MNMFFCVAFVSYSVTNVNGILRCLCLGDPLSESRVEEHLGFLLMYINPGKKLTAEDFPEAIFQTVKRKIIWTKPSISGFQLFIFRGVSQNLRSQLRASLKGSMGCFFFTEPWAFFLHEMGFR